MRQKIITNRVHNNKATAISPIATIERVKTPKPKKVVVRSSREDIINPYEERLLLANCNDLMDNIAVRFPLYLGLRLGEIQHCKLGWFEQREKLLSLPTRQICDCAKGSPCYECRKYRGGIWSPKTAAGIRVLLVPPTVEPYLLQIGNGLNCSRQCLEVRFRKIKRRAGLGYKSLYLHAISGTYATRLAESDISSISMMSLMGWDTLQSSEAYVKSSMHHAHAELARIQAS